MALFKPITKASFPINKIERLPDALRQAFRVATSGRWGRCWWTFRETCCRGRRLSWTYCHRSTIVPGRPGPWRPGPDLTGPRTPCCRPSGGYRGRRRYPMEQRREEVARLADLLGAAVGYFPTDGPTPYPATIRCSWAIWGDWAQKRVLRPSVMPTLFWPPHPVGQSTTFYDHRYIPADARIVQIEIDPEELGRNYPVEVGIEGTRRQFCGKSWSRCGNGNRAPTLGG